MVNQFDPLPGLKSVWKWLVGLGLVMMVGGALCFLDPFAASLTVLAIAGMTFLVAGALQLYVAFMNDGDASGHRILGAVLGFLLVVFAVALIADPLSGLVSLTVLAAMLFAMLGGLRIAMALRLRPGRGWGWLLVSGMVSAFLATFIILQLPEAAGAVLGLLLGIDLVSSGVTSLFFGLALRRLSKDT
ncbi:MAG: HdeD family acid-resistance protein [Brevirhabdus sp.]